MGTVATKSRFFAGLVSSNYAVKAKRANVVNEAAQAEYTQVILQLEATKRDINSKIFALEDMGPSQTTSLRVTEMGFDAKAWVKAQQELRLEMLLVDQELAVAKETYNYYFTATEEVEDEIKAGKKPVKTEDDGVSPKA